MTYISLNRFFVFCFFSLIYFGCNGENVKQVEIRQRFLLTSSMINRHDWFWFIFKRKKQVFSDTRRERLEGYNKSLVKVHSIHIKISRRKKRSPPHPQATATVVFSLLVLVSLLYTQDCQGKWDIGRVGCCVASKRWGESLLRFNKLKEEEEEQEKNPEGGS